MYRYKPGGYHPVCLDDTLIQRRPLRDTDTSQARVWGVFHLHHVACLRGIEGAAYRRLSNQTGCESVFLFSVMMHADIGLSKAESTDVFLAIKVYHDGR